MKEFTESVGWITLLFCRVSFEEKEKQKTTKPNHLVRTSFICSVCDHVFQMLGQWRDWLIIEPGTLSIGPVQPPPQSQGTLLTRDVEELSTGKQ